MIQRVHYVCDHKFVLYGDVFMYKKAFSLISVAGLCGFVGDFVGYADGNNGNTSETVKQSESEMKEKESKKTYSKTSRLEKAGKFVGEVGGTLAVGIPTAASISTIIGFISCNSRDRWSKDKLDEIEFAMGILKYTGIFLGTAFLVAKFCGFVGAYFGKSLNDIIFG